jgi:phospholipid/cholesterol/gamma-HCH transport system substrate-binding protein
MRKHVVNNIKLGVFVLAGLFFLVLLLYMIGRNQSLFAATFTIKARFDNVQGLVSGNNVRYAGIQVGTIKGINILNDTLIEVKMIIDDKMKSFIRQNAVASIGTDGLMGNKVINISPSRESAPLIVEGQTIYSRKAIDTDEMLRTLSNTNNDVAIIAENLKTTVEQINNSTVLWKLLNDNTLPQNLRLSAANVQLATARAAEMAKDMQALVTDVKNGKGSLGTLLTDTALAENLNSAIQAIKLVGVHAEELVTTINSVVTDVQKDVNNGKGTINALLKDSVMVVKLNHSMDNIQKGTDGFNQNMEALKHNFLFRGYFRKLEKQNQNKSKQNIVTQ